jgi:hypothetical protein
LFFFYSNETTGYYINQNKRHSVCVGSVCEPTSSSTTMNKENKILRYVPLEVVREPSSLTKISTTIINNNLTSSDKRSIKSSELGLFVNDNNNNGTFYTNLNIHRSQALKQTKAQFHHH